MYFFLRGPLEFFRKKSVLLRGHVTYILEVNICQENSLEQVPITALTAVMQKLSLNTKITCDSSDFQAYAQFRM